MGKTEQLDVEESMLKDVEIKGKKGYLVTTKIIILCLVVVVLLMIMVGLLSAYLGPGAKCSGGCGPTTNQPPSTPVLPTTNMVSTTVIGSEPFRNVRLPKTVLPVHYDLFLSVAMKTKIVTGSTNITVNVTAPTKYMIIHALKFNSLKGQIINSKGEVVNVVRDFSFEPNQYHVMELGADIPIGTYYVSYKFQYMLQTSLKGFYQSTYRTETGEEKLVAATQFEPVDARTAFPCFDEPAMKATFSFTMKHDSDYFAVSNMPVEKSWTGEGATYDRFEKSRIMPTYLIAFVVHDFANRTVTAKTLNPVNMTYFAPKEQIDQIPFAMDVGSKILPYFEKYYNVSYPLPKADMIAIPDFAAGAMENWGLITYRARALLYDDVASGISNQLYVASVVSHELAHQWFGNIVTMDWWSDLWLNEGFASYVEYFGINATKPDWNIMDFQVISDVSRALSLDALVTSHPVYIEVKHPDEINEIFDAISYSKGGSILRMLDDFVGNDVFLKGLNLYLNKHSYANAKTNDLWESLSEASRQLGKPKNVSAVMNTWILQMGFPVINVAKQLDGSFKLTQSRFLSDSNPNMNKSKFTSPYGYKWFVPFNYMVLNTTGTVSVVEEKATMSMNMSDASITLKSPSPGLLIKGNAGQYGFFRVNYDDASWKSIINILKTNHMIFDVKDRAGLLSDAFALANSGRLSYSTALDLFDYISNDTQYLPWKAATDAIQYIPSVLSSTRLAQRLYNKYMLNKVSPLFDKYGFKKITEFRERYLQVLIVARACYGGHTGCIANATEMFKKFKEDPDKNPVPADFRSLVYYFGVRNGGEEEWNFMFNRYRNNTIASEKTKLMYALSATQEPWILDRWLYMGINRSVVKDQDTSYVFQYVANSNPIGRYLAWNFMKENWATIEKRYAKSFFTMRRIFSSVTSGFTTQYELDQMMDFVDTKVKNAGTAKRIITQSEEKIQSSIAWLADNEKAVESWFKSKVSMSA